MYPIYYEHPAQFFQQSDWPQSKEKAQNRRKVEYKEQEESMLPAKLPNYATTTRTFLMALFFLLKKTFFKLLLGKF